MRVTGSSRRISPVAFSPANDSSRRFARVKAAFALLLLVFTARPGAAEAQESLPAAATSPWSKSTHSSLRLIAGPTAPSGKQRIGIEIVMEPGYKTYWRSPGESGVPLVFDWSGSENVGGLDVRWPVPERFGDSGGFAVGYVGEVVVPVSVQPVDPGKPVSLNLKLDYAVCEKICVPARGEATLWLEPGVTSVASPRLEQFEAQIPTPVKLGPAKERISILSAALEPKEPRGALKIVLSPPEGGAVEDVFVEGAGMWSFGRPVLFTFPDGNVVAKLSIIDRPKGAVGPTPFIITVRGKPGAVETRLELDIAGSKP